METITSSPVVREKNTWARVAGVAVTTLAVAAATIGSVWLVVQPAQPRSPQDKGSGKVIAYHSTREMANHIGCQATFSQSASPGTSTDAGQCTVNGVRVDLRIYPTPQEARSWLDGARTAEPLTTAGIYGGTWVASIHSQDRVTIDKIIVPLQEP
jgi:hypothetical protein